MDSGKTIDNAREINGLHYLDDENLFERQAQVANQSSSEEIMLWHFKLGHPSLSYLQHLFPKLFKNKQASKLQCEFCELSKRQRLNFCHNHIKNLLLLSLCTVMYKDPQE